MNTIGSEPQGMEGTIFFGYRQDKHAHVIARPSVSYYEKMPIQYAAIFKGCKISINWKNNIFLFVLKT